MVKLRLKRLGNRNRPFYRLNAVDSRVKRDGVVLEELGYYNPLDKEEGKQIRLNLERCAYWLSVGAQPSDTAKGLLKRAGLTPKSGTKPADQAALKPAGA